MFRFASRQNESEKKKDKLKGYLQTSRQRKTNNTTKKNMINYQKTTNWLESKGKQLFGIISKSTKKTKPLFTN